jgi:4-aminobutyrate aminotransferase
VNEEWLERYERSVAGVLPGYFDLIAASAHGAWITDIEGRRYLDFGSGIAVANIGHSHPDVVAAIQAQAEALIHTSVVFKHRGYIELAEAIGGLCPFFAQPQVFLCNSGAEAVDGSLKLARQATGKPGVIAFERAFHGRTLAATSLTTAKAKYRTGYEPLLPSVYFAPYGGNVEDLFTSAAPPENVGAMIVEPVLGEGGYVPAARGWLAGLRALCDEHGIVLIFDEVQCGFGRTGNAFAAQTYGVTPDVLLFAKGVASGLPLGGIVAERSLMERWPQGAHGSTFGGNPVSCASALATIDVMLRDNLFARARALGERALRQLRCAVGRSVVDVRGLGLMIAVQFASSEEAHAVQERCLADGLVVLTCGPDDDTLRLAPPLTLTDEELALGLATLITAIQVRAAA